MSQQLGVDDGFWMPYPSVLSYVPLVNLGNGESLCSIYFYWFWVERHESPCENNFLSNRSACVTSFFLDSKLSNMKIDG